jgi:PAS domain S-box-containing protein
MNLSRKIVLVIISTFIALVFIVAATSDIILLNSFANLERKVLKDDVSKVINEIEESFPELDASAKDYVEQFQHGGPEQISNLDVSSFTTHRIDFIACYSSNGELVAAKAADFHGKRYDELTREHHGALRQATRYLVEKSGKKTWHGFMPIGDATAQIAIRPFGVEHVIVVGKYLDKEEIRRVAALTKFTVDVQSYNASSLPEDFLQAKTNLDRGSSFYAAVIDNGHVAGYYLFNDIYDKPVLLLKISERRLIYEQGKASITYIILALIISGGVFCGVMLLFIRGAVLKRLATLISTVGDISRHGDISERLEIKGEDELEELAGSINSMLSSLESAEMALKDSEERYRALFERAPDSIFIVDTEADTVGRIINANRAACEQHGYTYEEICAMRIQDLNTPETNQISSQLMEKIMRGEWVTQEVWHYKKDGSQFPIEVHAGLIKHNGRSFILGFDRDITSRKLAEESDRMYLDQIRQLNIELGCKAAELSVANKELESFNYSVSHDMRGPLTRISGYCQVMLDDGVPIDSEIRTYVTRIYESCCWLDEMIDAMLKLSQLARIDVMPVEVSLSAMVEGLLRDLAQAEPERTIEMVIEPDVKVIGDAQLLKILVSNLINNSWKYSAGTEHTRIEFGTMNGTSCPVYFVRDNGTGFDMKDSGKLFRVFTRLHEHSQFSGSGIGLATVQRVIARHGGRIWAEGEVGRGATFFFTLAPDVSSVQPVNW